MLINLITFVTLAVVGSVAPVPGANALSVESHNFVRNGAGHAHAARNAALNRRQTNTARPRRCKARPTESALSSSGAGSPATTSKAQAAPSNDAPKPTTTPAAPAPPAPSSSKPAAAPKPSSTKAAAPAPTQGNGGGRTSKKACVTYVGNVDVVKFASGTDTIGCVINWSSWKPTFMNQLRNAVFVPMLHGPGQVKDVQRNVVAGFSNFILGVNEPNQSGQSTMSPQAGADLWLQHMQPLKSQGYQLISPACTNAPSGLQWLKDFQKACVGCTVDAIATHFYGTDAEALIAHLNQYHDTFGKDIWLTEYACQDFSGRNAQCSPDKTWAFMDRTVSFMEATPWVARYAWFGALQPENLGGVDPVNRLIRDDSSPTPLGLKYLGLA